MKAAWLLAMAAGLGIWAGAAAAAEYFVAPGGDDKNPGTAGRPFATLQKGADLLKAGDTLTVAPGVYRQSVRLGKVNGEKDKPVTIRAAIPKTAILIGSTTVTGWARTPGARNTWSAALAAPTHLVYERDTNREYMELADLYLVDEQAGAFAYDETRKRIYVHTADSAPPDSHRIDAAVLGMGFDAWSGGPADWHISLRKHLVIEGFVLEGFANAGIHIMRGDGCEVRDCVAHHCGAGIFMHSSIRGAIRRCEASWCYDRNDNEGGGIAFRGTHFDNTVEDCVVHDIVKYGIRHYGGGFQGCNIFNSLAYRVGRCAIHTKGKLDTERAWADRFSPPASNEPIRVWNNVSVEPAHPHTVLFDCWGMRNNTVGGPSFCYRLGMGEKKETQLAFAQDKVDQQGFADPFNYDFRLQSDSPNRGKGKGAFEYKGGVFFVKPGGDDAAEGTAMSKAWKDAGKALERLRPGQTLYVAAGRYAVSARMKLAGGVAAVRAWGGGDVVFDGQGADVALAVEGPGRLEARGLRFTGCKAAAVSVSQASVLMEKCVFDKNWAGASIAGAGAARFEKCVFADNSCHLHTAAEDARVLAYGCVFSGAGGAFGGRGKVFSEFNLFGGPVTMDGRRSVTLDAWRRETGQDTESVMAIPLFRDEAAGDYRLAEGSPGRGSGWLWSPAGLEDTPRHWRESPAPPVFEDVAPSLVTPTMANLTWRVRGPKCTAFVRYGQAPDKLDTLVQRDTGQHLGNFHAVTLFDLKPSTTYYYQLGSGPYRMMFADRLKETVEGGQPVWESETRRFTTPASFSPKRRTFYVSTLDGDDANDGLSREKAWASLHKASRAAEPGDRVLVSKGEYFGLLRPVNSGLPGAPIVFEAAPGERVELSGKRLTQPISALILDKRHITIRGFVFKEHCKMLQDDAGNGAQIMIMDSQDIRVEKCLFDGRMYYMMNAGVYRSGDVRFENNIFYAASNYTGILLGMNTGAVVFDHNTLFQAGVSHVQAVANAEVTFTNNIVGEKIQVKWISAGIGVMGNKKLVFDRNYYAFDDANKIRYAMNIRPGEGEAAVECKGPDPLAGARKLGLERNGKAGPKPWAREDVIAQKSKTVRGVEPAAQNLGPLEWSDFALKPGAACRGMAAGGGDPGARIETDAAGKEKP